MKKKYLTPSIVLTIAEAQTSILASSNYEQRLPDDSDEGVSGEITGSKHFNVWDNDDE